MSSRHLDTSRLPDRLYMVIEERDENPEEIEYDTYFTNDPDEIPGPNCPKPDVWSEICLAKWGEERPFFYPSLGGVYRSRSAAQGRANLVNFWGGNAVVVECEPAWSTLEAAKKRRETVRLNARKARLLEQVADLDEKLWAVAS